MDNSLLTFTDAVNQCNKWAKENALPENFMRDKRIQKIFAAVNEYEDRPNGWGKTKWRKAVALKHAVSSRSLHTWHKLVKAQNYKELIHTKPSAGQARDWSPEALEFWQSLVIKKEHRHINIKNLYALLVVEANQRGWKIGGEKSAYWWKNKLKTPTLTALQRGGMRALDNILPPILRDYSDLAPFQILVGDQHRFDRWVMDEETGEIFRPEGYLWQDLRTRMIYGAAVDKKYDAWLIGLALRIGISVFGAFGSIYTDNGRPELSKFIMHVLLNMRSLGMEWEKTDEKNNDIAVSDNENINPCQVSPGTHRKAIVKNAKAKMIEGTFYRLEEIMSSVMLLPGHTKRMADDIHWQEVDHHEAQKLAKRGKLLTNREFVISLYKAIDYYNRQKPHRGVLSEWSWNPKPKEVTPYDCLLACHNDGWQPRMISSQAADLIFLARDSRIVNKGTISLNNEIYVADELIDLHKQKIDIRFNPMTFAEVHVFHKNKFICTAFPVEKSSMIDADLSSQKIAEKRERRLRFAEEFKKISSIAPDFRNYSSVPQIERAAAVIGGDKRRRLIENKRLNKKITQEELDEGVRQLEELNKTQNKKKVVIPARPNFWLNDIDRLQWSIRAEAAGLLSNEDKKWLEDNIATMPDNAKDRWTFEREFLKDEFANVEVCGNI